MHQYLIVGSDIIKFNSNMSHTDAKGHRCQVDCTNHDQVITALQLKSKDLYYFWRNYEWLYTKYYSQSQPQQPAAKPIAANHDRCQRQIESLQQKNEELKRQNRKLEMDLQALRKQLADKESAQKMENSYRLELEKERSNAKEAMGISQKYRVEIKKLKDTLAAMEDEHDADRERLKKDNKKRLQDNLELQQTIDELRARPPPTIQPQNPPSPPSYAEFEELSRRQSTTISSRIRHVAAEAQQIVALEYDGVRRELEERLAEMLSQLTQNELQTLIVSVEQ